jgi:hypothetical protein
LQRFHSVSLGSLASGPEVRQSIMAGAHGGAKRLTSWWQEAEREKGQGTSYIFPRHDLFPPNRLYPLLSTTSQ